jgi:hypothetical protein
MKVNHVGFTVMRTSHIWTNQVEALGMLRACYVTWQELSLTGHEDSGVGENVGFPSLL